jgi:hypothetical protein
MDLTPYLLQGFNVLKNTTVTISGYAVAMDAIFDNNNLAHDKQLTFLEDEQIPVIVKTLDLKQPYKDVIGKKCVLALDGETYRIDSIRTGQATSFLYLNSKDKA